MIPHDTLPWSWWALLAALCVLLALLGGFVWDVLALYLF